MRSAAILLFVLFCATYAHGQHSSNAYRILADSLYRHHHYQYAAEYYEKALKKAPDPGYLMLQLAKSFDKLSKPATAEQWFSMAASKKAKFDDEDYYLYAEVLIAQQKFAKADSLLQRAINRYPDLNLAQQTLNDLRNVDKFYADSALFKVSHLSINSEVAEFSPAYFKGGLVFTSARFEGALKKKYHWDNSSFLNLYYTAKTPNGLGAPVLFEKQLNTRHHDGPAIFFDNFGSMILNRNQRMPASGREEVFEMRPGLFEGIYDTRKSDWIVSPLPFNNPEYSFSHPWISEDGNTLYFASDIPGGKGGLDLYRATRIGGVWGTPENLGAAINTIEDEAFPFFVQNTLYFASTGHGGLGGLDIFFSNATPTGFSMPVNAGYPINSFADDFSLITDSLQLEGYFASSRKGNDDIYSFKKADPRIHLLAHIYDGHTKLPLGNAHIEVITNGGDDQILTADERGNFEFLLPRHTPYIVVGTKDDLLGMVSDVADSTKTHHIPAYRDTTTLACIGFVKNDLGIPETATAAEVVDLTTGEKTPYSLNQSIISFRGKKGHNYNVIAQNARGNTGSHQLSIAAHDKGKKIFTITIPTTGTLADNNTPSTLLILDTEDGGSKAFISSNNDVKEVTEKDGELHVNNEKIGRGTLADLKTNPSKVLEENGLGHVTTMALRNVYFDFDKWSLDDDDMARLLDVKNVLNNQSAYQLTISGHADDRGEDNYNEKLSRRRSDAVAMYLISQGVDKRKIVLKAYGESKPYVPCPTGDCSEDDHQLNRRTEFLLQAAGTVIASQPDARHVASNRRSATSPAVSPSFSELLQRHGNTSIDGIRFRVGVGAFRLKKDLKFPELASVGTVKTEVRNGITYYFLDGYTTLAAAERARLEAVAKGVVDATITVYHNGDRIKMEDFAALAR